MDEQTTRRLANRLVRQCKKNGMAMTREDARRLVASCQRTNTIFKRPTSGTCFFSYVVACAGPQIADDYGWTRAVIG